MDSFRSIGSLLHLSHPYTVLQESCGCNSWFLHDSVVSFSEQQTGEEKGTKFKNDLLNALHFFSVPICFVNDKCFIAKKSESIGFGQKVCVDFSFYRKTWMNFLANPINTSIYRYKNNYWEESCSTYIWLKKSFLETLQAQEPYSYSPGMVPRPVDDQG